MSEVEIEETESKEEVTDNVDKVENDEGYIEIKKTDDKRMVLVIALIVLLAAIAFCAYVFIKENNTSKESNQNTAQEQTEADKEVAVEGAINEGQEEDMTQEELQNQTEEAMLLDSDTSSRSIDPYVPAENTQSVQSQASVYGQPVISGVTNGYSYKGKVTPTFSIGTATLNGVSYKSGTPITADGKYTLIVANGSKTTTVKFTIDNTPPTISLNGGDVIVSFGDGYSDYGVTVYDNISESSKIRINKHISYSSNGIGGPWTNVYSVNTWVSGVYMIEYSATDENNNTSGTVRRFITVEDYQEIE